VDVELYKFSGDHYEIGLQQGRATPGMLKKGSRSLQSFNSVKLFKPRLIPSRLFLWLAKRQAVKLMERDLPRYYPRQWERTRGISEGGEVDMPTLLFLQSMELLLAPGESSFTVPGCTSLAIGPERTAKGEIIMVKNFDYPSDFSQYSLTCISQPTGRYKTLGCTKVVLPGMLDGMNEHGLTVTYNYAYTIEKPTYSVPISVVLQEMLETCRNTDEAVEFVTQAKRAGGALLTIGDPGGNIKSIEISSNHFAILPAVDGQIINGNHFQTEEMREWEIPRDAVFSSSTPREFQGLRVHESSEKRLERARELLGDNKAVNEDLLAEIMQDHGKDDDPSNLTICQHGDFISTTRSVILYPNRKRIRVLYGNPCQNGYTEHGF
jgi:predicted choloylglycine hydrolase